MLMDGRIGEIEARLQDRLRDLDAALARLAAQEQLASQLASGMGGVPGMSAGGTYYADPAAVTINPGEAELLEVWEAAYPTGKLVGERLVINLMSEATAADMRLLLSRNRDGSYTAIQQDCPEEEE